LPLFALSPGHRFCAFSENLGRDHIDMDNFLRAFEKCFASIVTTEQVSPPSNLVRTLCVLRPAITVRSPSALALAHRVQRSTCSWFPRRISNGGGGCQALIWRQSSTTTTSLWPGYRARHPRLRGPTGTRTGRSGCRGARVAGKRRTPHLFFTVCAPLFPSSLRQAVDLSAQRGIAVASGSGPELGYETDRSYNSRTSQIGGSCYSMEMGMTSHDA
jgi:hypothetical protein